MRDARVAALLLLVVELALGDDGPVRRTTKGRIRGFYHREPGTSAEVYLGVPYAAPPVGELRFESPVPMAAWEGEVECTSEGPWCVQFWYANQAATKKRQASEDCLTMNLFVPANLSASVRAKAPFPILMWIHGGSYQVNGANMFPVSGTVRNLVSQGQIVAIVNYRLGPLGFLSTLSKELHGNYGLEDQLAALEWLRENAEAIGGDKDRITVGGESAGAASASILAVSPRAEGRFARAMLRSGSSLAPWAVRSSNTDLNSLLLVKWSRCGDGLPDMSLVKKCLQKLPTEDFVKMWGVLGNQDLMYVVSNQKKAPANWNHPFLAHTYFTPVVDAFRGNSAILPAYPSKLIPLNARMPIMTGVTTAECTAYITWLYYLVSRGSARVDVKDLEFVVPDVSYANSAQVKQAVSHRYVWHEYAMTGFSFGRALVKIASDQNFVSPATLEAELYAQAGHSVHTYVFHHPLQVMDAKFAKYGIYDAGSAHGYDMVYWFRNTSVLETEGRPFVNWTRADELVMDILSRTSANFVAHGDPEVSDMPGQWPRFTKDCGRALRISPSLELTTFFPEVRQFWRETIPVVESLRLQPGCYDNAPECVESCHLDYKLAFCLLLTLTALLLLVPLTVRTLRSLPLPLECVESCHLDYKLACCLVLTLTALLLLVPLTVRTLRYVKRSGRLERGGAFALTKSSVSGQPMLSSSSAVEGLPLPLSQDEREAAAKDAPVVLLSRSDTDESNTSQGQ